MKMPFLLISPKIVPKIQLIKKGGCFEYHAVIADKIKYRYVHRASICPALGMDRRSFFMPKPMGKYKRLEVFYLSKPVYTADKPSDCHYCYFWTNGRKGCRLGRNNCYYLISLPPKPKSECDGCPYGRDHPCIGWCTKKVMLVNYSEEFDDISPALLAKSFQKNAEMISEYRVLSSAGEGIDYQGKVLLNSRAVRLLSYVEDMSGDEKVRTIQSKELWLAEDMTFYVVSCMSTITMDKEEAICLNEHRSVVTTVECEDDIFFDMGSLICELDDICLFELLADVDATIYEL